MKRMLLVTLVILALITVLTFSKEAAAPTFMARPPPGSNMGCLYKSYGYVYTGGVTNCVESDKGMKPCTPGGISYTDSSGSSQSAKDSCTSEFFLSEWVCAGNEVREYHIGCTKECEIDAATNAARCKH